MNKLMGFFELQNSSLPTIPWKEYNLNTVLDDSLLWTIRTAVLKGGDFNLPRSVGENAEISMAFAKNMLEKLRDKGMVIYYPYFVAIKSGTLHVMSGEVVIEAVKDDLWNLVTYSNREVTIRINGDNVSYDGNEVFLTKSELGEITNQVSKIKSLFRSYFIEGKSILLEWSYALNCDIKKNPSGIPYLVFYEARTLE